MSEATEAPRTESPRQILDRTADRVTAASQAYLESSKGLLKIEPERSRDGILEEASRDVEGLSTSTEPYDKVKESYKSIIEQLYEAREAKQGIKRTVEGDIIIRDARNATDIDRHSPEAIAANYINICRAAEVMLEDALKRDASEVEVKNIRALNRKRVAAVIDAVKNNENVTGKTLIHLTDELISDLEGVKNAKGEVIFKDANITLDRAKSLTNLDDDHRHVVTITTVHDAFGNPRNHVESDVMLQGTHPELQAQYKAIIDGRNEPSWYKKLPKEQQALVKRYAPDLRDGNKSVSSQLFDFIPGMKNAFLKRTEIGGAKSGSQLEKISEVLHAGTPVFDGKDDKTKGTSLAVRQAKQFAPDGDEFTLHVLNSGANEGHIVNPLKDHEDAKVDFAPVNPTRRVSHTSHHASDRTLREVTDKVKDAMEENSVIRKYLEKGETKNWFEFWKKSDQQKAYTAVAAIEASGQKDISGIPTKDVTAAIRLKSSKERSSGFFKHNNFRISADALVTEFLNIVKRTRLLFCKSGKDRTGSVLFKTAHLAVSDHLGLTAAAKAGDAKAKERMAGNLSSLAHAGHSQYMAGGPGGTIGAFGIKPGTTATSLDKDLKSVGKHLGLETADRNKVKKRGKSGFGFKPGHDYVAHKVIQGSISPPPTPVVEGAGGGRSR